MSAGRCDLGLYESETACDLINRARRTDPGQICDLSLPGHQVVDAEIRQPRMPARPGETLHEKHRRFEEPLETHRRFLDDEAAAKTRVPRAWRRSLDSSIRHAFAAC